MTGLVDLHYPRHEMQDEIGGRDGRRATVPGLSVAPTVEDSAAVMPHNAKGADPRGCHRIMLLARGYQVDDEDTWMVVVEDDIHEWGVQCK